MKVEEALKAQNEVVRMLNNAYKNNLLSHAYLFEGDKGSGKYEIAIYMAMLLLCDSNTKPCYKCHNCLRIINNNHLNVNCIEPSGDIIKKEQIDNFVHELMMTSLEKGAQIGIIKDADKMNASATNALLKVLEEPAPNHYIFLLTTNIDRLLDTIISRTQVIRFKPVSHQYLLNQLQNNGVEIDMAYVLSYITSNIDDAKKLIEEGKVYNLLSIAKEIEKNIAKGKDPLVIFIKNKEIFKTEEEKKYHRIFLDILMLINKEIINVNNNINNGYFNDVINIYNNTKINNDKIIQKLNVLSKYQERLNYYVNLNLFYTSLMVEINK